MKLVAITSCPTGIAHSQMAAENLETTAEEMGHEIKVEVQGAMGAQNELTDEDVAGADAVIITADTSVQTDRFGDLPLVKGTVKDGVNDAERMIREAVDAAEAGASGTVAGDDEAADASDEDGGDGDATADAAAGSNDDDRRGGDPEKGLFARLKRLFS